jgi:hypothetical protein
MAEIDYSIIPNEDLKILYSGTLEGVSTPTLQYLLGEGGSSWDAFTSNLKRGVTSSLRGLGVLRPDYDEDMRAEQESRMALETNPIAGWTGLIAGSILDPVTLPAAVLKPIAIGGKIATGAIRGATAGAFGGALDPTYETMGDNKTLNIVTGLTLGGGLGAGAAALLRKFGIDADLSKATPEEVDAKLAEVQDKIDTLPEEQQQQLLLEWNGQLKVEPAFKASDKPMEWNPELKSLETVEEVASDVDLTLPTQVKKAVKINKVDAEFANDLDHAFWVAGENNGVSAKAAQSWLMEKTGMNLREVQNLSKQVRSELARRVGQSKTVDGKLKIDTPSVWSATLIPKLAPPRVVRTPIQPSRIDVKDGLDPTDVENLRLVGINVTPDGKGNVQFRGADGKFVSASVLKERMNAVGIDLDVPGYREKIQATKTVPQEELTKVAEDAPVIRDAEAEAQVQSISKTGGGGQVNAPKAQDVLDIPPEDIGIPKENRSAGSAGVNPRTYLTPELMPKTMKDVAKGGEMRERVLMRMLENDDPRVALPKDMDARVTGKGTFAALKKAGAAKLKALIAEHGNMAEFMLYRKGRAENMSADEVTAFRWFYADSMANRAKVLTRVRELVDAGESLDTQEASELARDLVYYTGIDLFYKNDGTKASRAMAARRIISQTIQSGQTPQTKMMRGIFPGMGCQ